MLDMYNRYIRLEIVQKRHQKAKTQGWLVTTLQEPMEGSQAINCWLKGEGHLMKLPLALHLKRLISTKELGQRWESCA